MEEEIIVDPPRWHLIEIYLNHYHSHGYPFIGKLLIRTIFVRKKIAISVTNPSLYLCTVKECLYTFEGSYKIDSNKFVPLH
jgi:hypothetical protein